MRPASPAPASFSLQAHFLKLRLREIHVDRDSDTPEPESPRILLPYPYAGSKPPIAMNAASFLRTPTLERRTAQAGLWRSDPVSVDWCTSCARVSSGGGLFG